MALYRDRPQEREEGGGGFGLGCVLLGLVGCGVGGGGVGGLGFVDFFFGLVGAFFFFC